MEVLESIHHEGIESKYQRAGDEGEGREALRPVWVSIAPTQARLAVRGEIHENLVPQGERCHR